MRYISAVLIPRRNLCTAEKDISTSLTSDKMLSIRRSVSLMLDLTIERMDVTVPAAVSSLTTKAMTLNGSIF
jgi:hypothetical protein